MLFYTTYIAHNIVESLLCLYLFFFFSCLLLMGNCFMCSALYMYAFKHIYACMCTCMLQLGSAESIYPLVIYMVYHIFCYYPLTQFLKSIIINSSPMLAAITCLIYLLPKHMHITYILENYVSIWINPLQLNYG